MRSQRTLAVLMVVTASVSLSVEFFALYTLAWYVDVLAHVCGGLAVACALGALDPRMGAIGALWLMFPGAILWEVFEASVPWMAGYYEYGALDTISDILLTISGALVLSVRNWYWRRAGPM